MPRKSTARIVAETLAGAGVAVPPGAAPQQSTGPRVIDIEVVRQMVAPITVQLFAMVRDAVNPHGRQNPEPRSLPKDGCNWTTNDALMFAQGKDLSAGLGGGFYFVKMVDTNGLSAEGYFQVPGKPRMSVEQQADQIIGDAVTQAQARAVAQQQATNLGIPLPPQAPPQQPNGAPGQIPISPFQQQAQQWLAQQQAQQNAQWGGLPPPVGNGFQFYPGPNGNGAGNGNGGGMWNGWNHPQAAPAWGGGYLQGYPQQQPPPWWANQNQPPAPPAPTGSNPLIEAKLAALEQQNAQLREDVIRRQASEGVDRLAGELRSFMQSTEQRFNAMLEKLGSNNNRGSSDVDLRLAQMERESREQIARMEAKGQQDELRREMVRIQDEGRRQTEGLQLQLQTAQQQGQHVQQQAILDRLATVQQEAASAQREAFEKALSREPKLMEMLAMFKQLQGDDPFASKVKDIMLDQFLNPSGGQPSTAQVVASLGQAALDGVGKVTEAWLGSKSRSDQMRLAAKANADKQLAELRARQAGGGSLSGAAAPSQAAAAAAATSAQAAAAPPPAAPVVAEVMPSVPSEIVVDDDGSLVAEEKRYFGPFYEPIQKLRAAVAINRINAEGIIEAIIDGILFFAGFEVPVPVLLDLEKSPATAIARTLPDMSELERSKIAEALPIRLKERIHEMEEDERDDGKAA